jgi:hypothetical protein
MQIQISYTRKAMQEAVEQAKKFSDLYAKASREIAKPVPGGGHDAAEQTKKIGLKGANEGGAPRGLRSDTRRPGVRAALSRPEPYAQRMDRSPCRLRGGGENLTQFAGATISQRKVYFASRCKMRIDPHIDCRDLLFRLGVADAAK